MQLGKVSRRIGGGELPKARSSDISRRLLRVRRVLEERDPDRLCDTFQLQLWAIADHLFQCMKCEKPLLLVRLNELDNSWKEEMQIADGDVTCSESSRTPDILVCRSEEINCRLEHILLMGKVTAEGEG